MRSSALITLVSGGLLITAIACGGDDTSGGGGGTGGTVVTATGGVSNATGGGTATGGVSNATGGTSATGGSSGTGNETYFEAAAAGLDVGLGTYNYMDTGGSTAVLTNPTAGQLCLKGVAKGHNMSAYDTNWGGGIGIALVSDADKKAGMGFDVTAATDIKFTLSGTGIPPELRVGLAQVDDPDNSFFSTTVAEGANTLTFESLAQGNWVTSPVTKDFTKVTDLQFQVASQAADVSYDFCISDIKIGDLTWDMGAGGGAGM